MKGNQNSLAALQTIKILKTHIENRLLQVLKIRKFAKQFEHTKCKGRTENDSGGTMKSNQYYSGKNQLILEKDYHPFRVLHDLWEFNPYLFTKENKERILKQTEEWKINYSSEENIFKSVQAKDPCYEYVVHNDTVYVLVNCNTYYSEYRILTFNECNTVITRPFAYEKEFISNLLKKFTLTEEIAFNLIKKDQVDDICSLFHHDFEWYVFFDSNGVEFYNRKNNEWRKQPKSGFGLIFSFSLSQICEVAEYREKFVQKEIKKILYSNSEKLLLAMDARRASIQQYDKLLLTDNNLGSWDLFCDTQKHASSPFYSSITLDEYYEARDPRKDVQKSEVAIDFGTTSTVVAVKNNRGQSKLLRIGVQNMQEAVQAKHFENPTVLGVEDYPSFMQDWQTSPYKPYTKWADLQCSHQAKAELADKMQSGLVHLKTWARGKASDNPLRLTDQKGNEFIIQIPNDFVIPLEEYFNTAEFNPIEVYAYLLGLNLNNQLIEGGKIYTTYYMTFPVKFDRETKERILASFRRGLLRSLPPSLIYADGWNENSFVVEEHANEPTAFAAAVLPVLPADEEETDTENKEKKKIEYIKATQEGVPFGVFDFGGGTADFSFGLYRLPDSVEEADYGWEQVLDILDSSGDENLGGEHLVQLLAFNVIRNNAPTLLENGIAFTKPLEYEHFSGDELLFSYSGAARINMAKLCEKLRPIWENGELDQEEESKGKISETFIDSSGEIKANISLEINIEELKQILVQRIEKGVEAFFTTFRQAFKRHNIAPQSLHIILAGNSCKSPYVQDAFKKKKESILTTENTNDQIIIHKPLLPNPDNPESITLKTGVALGLLKTLDGEPVGIKVRYSSCDETFFNFTVGYLEQEKLHPVLIRDSAYNEWKPFRKVFNHGKCKILYSNSPLAIESVLGREECIEENIDFGKENAGKTIFIRPVKPTIIEVALSKSTESEEIDEQSIQSLELK